MPKVSKVGSFRKAALATKAGKAKPVASKPSTTTIPPEAVVKDDAAVAATVDVVVPTANDASNKKGGAKQKQMTADALSRGQRKRQAKREQYLQRENMILSSLRLKKAEEQKTRIDGMDAMRKALLDTVVEQEGGHDAAKEEKPTSSLLKSSKSRKELVGKEVTQMNLVMQHPAFQADPFATIREHLQNTIAKDVEKQKKQAITYAKERKSKEESKKVVKKENGAKKKRKKVRATRSKAR